MAFSLPTPLPVGYDLQAGAPATVTAKKGSSKYDVAFNGLGFRFANDKDTPIIRQLADNQRQRVDQAREAGEQTLTNWWLRSQASFHGGGGQIHYEPPFPFATDKIRFDASKNVDVWTQGAAKLLPQSRSLAGTAPDGDLCSLSTATNGDALAYRVGSTVKMIVPGGNPTPVNIVTNSNFETDTSGWALGGVTAPTSFVSDATHATTGTKGGKVTWGAGATSFPNVSTTVTTVPGQVYTLALDVYVPAGSSDVQLYVQGLPGVTGFGPTSSSKNVFVRLTMQFTATNSSHPVGLLVLGSPAGGETAWIDSVVVNVGATDGLYSPTPPTGDATTTISPGATVTALCTDGLRLFMTAGTKVYRADAASAWAAVEIYSGILGSRCKLAYVKDRIILADSNKVYQLDANKGSTTVIGSGELIYTHPFAAFVWDGFTHSQSEILGYGWDGILSTITQFSMTNAAGTIPVLAAAGVLTELPAGERLKSAKPLLGTFLAMTTTAGVRVGSFTFYGFVQGPLSVAQTLLNGCAVQDRFVYVAAAAAPDEPGLIRVDLGVVIDPAGRCGWANDRLGPTQNLNTATTGGEVAVLPTTGRLVYWDAQGLYLSDPAIQQTRTGWLRTSRVRFDTTEPKLFKAGTVKMGPLSGSLAVSSVDDTGFTSNLATFYSQPQGDFQLTSGPRQWTQLTFTLSAGADLREWQMKTLPGTPRAQIIQVTLAAQDHESTRSGQQVISHHAARTRFNQLMVLAQAGDEVVFQEYDQTGVITSSVVIEQCLFKQVGRPTATAYFGGDIVVTMRTVS